MISYYLLLVALPNRTYQQSNSKYMPILPGLNIASSPLKEIINSFIIFDNNLCNIM